MSSVQAQTYPTFTNSVNIDVNNIKAAHLLHGDQWWNPALGTDACEYPKASGKNVSGAATLWMSGYDAQNNLHVAAQTYRQNGNDYWPGPIDTSSALSTKYATSQKWAHFWLINKTSLDSFRALATHTTANTPQNILEWPAKGNPNARGAGSAALTISGDLAPFIDVNNDGNYNALDGDYPDMKGDQMIWWLINDKGVTHTESNGLPMGVEIQNRVYAYKRGTLIDNVVYYEYTITNKSANTYSQMRLGLNDDVDLGYAFDDYIGFDSARRLGFVYNGTSVDGSGQAGSYGFNIPAAGVTFVAMPGDNAASYVPVGSYSYYNNDFSANGNPSSAVQYNNLLRSENTSGTAFASGSRYAVYDSTECKKNNAPGDRRFILTSSDLSLAPGASQKIVLALVIAPNVGGCPNMNFGALLTTADTAWGFYHSQVTTGVNGIPAPTSLRMYPNPAHDVLYVEPDNTGNISAASLLIYDIAGRRLILPVTQVGQKLEVATGALPAGIYTLIYRSGGSIQRTLFTKQ